MSDVTAVVGLGFGDEGKGSIVDYLARSKKKPPTVVRYNGGSQAAHNVVAPDGKHHTFAQFGSATLVDGARTHLSQYMLIDLFALRNEAKHLVEIDCDPFDRLSVDERAVIITPFHIATNRIREATRSQPHGSCGMGIGETMMDFVENDIAVFAKDLRSPGRLLKKLEHIQALKYQDIKHLTEDLPGGEGWGISGPRTLDVTMLTDPMAPSLFASAMCSIAKKINIVSPEWLKGLFKIGPIIFEGAQGILLDEWFGFHPHTTWSTITTENVLDILDEIEYTSDFETLGVLRAYHTRHGVGPFPTGDSLNLPDAHNVTNEWQGEFRSGWFDAVLARYAIEICPVDYVALTNLDRLDGIENRKVAVGYISQKRTITDLPHKTYDLKRNLHWSEKITNLAYKAKPVYVDISSDQSEYVAKIEKQIGEYISIISLGPCAQDKIETAMKI